MIDDEIPRPGQERYAGRQALEVVPQRPGQAALVRVIRGEHFPLVHDVTELHEGAVRAPQQPQRVPLPVVPLRQRLHAQVQDNAELVIPA